MNERQSLETAYRRLLDTLAELARDAARQAVERCPYRALHDHCTFPARCRNQLGNAADRYRCSGARLNASPALVCPGAPPPGGCAQAQNRHRAGPAHA